MNQKLEDAVKRGDVQAVGDLLSAGHRDCMMGDYNEGDLLHAARHTSMVKLLVSRGASVNKRNCYGKTPLWVALADNKSTDCIRALLEAGAHVHCFNSNYASVPREAYTNKYKDLSVLRLLLDFGADIHYNEEYFYYNHLTVLGLSFYDVNCSRMLIRFQVLRRGQLYMKPFANQEHYDELVQYHNLCMLEVARMRTEVLGSSGGVGTLTLYQFMVAKPPRLFALAQTIYDDLLQRYPLYCEDIHALQEATLERSRLLKDLDGVQMCAVGQEGACLNHDCMRSLGRYLSDEELRNLVAASQVDDEDSADNDSVAKQPRLE